MTPPSFKRGTKRGTGLVESPTRLLPGEISTRPLYGPSGHANLRTNCPQICTVNNQIREINARPQTEETYTIAPPSFKRGTKRGTGLIKSPTEPRQAEPKPFTPDVYREIAQPESCTVKDYWSRFFPIHFQEDSDFMVALTEYIRRLHGIHVEVTQARIKSEVARLSDKTPAKAALMIQYSTPKDPYEIKVAAKLIAGVTAVLGYEPNRRVIDLAMLLARDIIKWYDTISGDPGQVGSPRYFFPNAKDFTAAYADWFSEKYAGWNAFNINTVKYDGKSWHSFISYVEHKVLGGPFHR